MTPEVNAHSFDRPRERSAPDVLRGRWSRGDEATIPLTRPTLVVAIKSNCDGCRDFINADLEELDDVDVVVVSASDDVEGEWSDAPRKVLVAPEVLASLDIRWPPFYVLIDPTRHLVVCEGVLFGPSQVAEEITRHLP